MFDFLSEKAKNNFFIKYRLYLFVIILLFLTVISLFVAKFVYVVFGIALLLMLLDFNNTENLFGYMLFLLSFREVLKINKNDTSLFTILLFIAIIIFLINYFLQKCYKNKNSLIVLFLVIVFGIYTIVPRQSFQLKSYLFLFVNIMLAYFAVVFKSKYDTKKLLIVFTAGLIASCILGAFRFQIPRIRMLLTGDLVCFDTFRWRFLYYDMNFLTAAIAISMSMYFYFYIKGAFKFSFYPVFISLSALGFLTLSKSFFLIYLAIILMFVCFVCLDKKSREEPKKATLKVLFVILICATLCTIFSNRLSIIFGRSQQGYYDVVKNEDSTKVTVDSVLTGRLEIWKNYFNFFKNNPLYLIFGTGVHEHFLQYAAHNVIIEMIYAFGLVGVLMILVISLFLIIKLLKRKQVGFVNFYTLIVLFVISMFLNFIYIPNFGFYISLAVAVLLDNKERLND